MSADEDAYDYYQTEKTAFSLAASQALKNVMFLPVYAIIALAGKAIWWWLGATVFFGLVLISALSALQTVVLSLPLMVASLFFAMRKKLDRNSFPGRAYGEDLTGWSWMAGSTLIRLISDLIYLGCCWFLYRVFFPSA